MSVIEKLDSVLALVGKAAPGEWTPHPTMDYSICLQDGSFIDITRHRAFSEVAERDAIIATLNLLRDHGPAIRQAMIDAERLDFIERSFSGMTNCERYLPVRMIWGKGCNGRTLREACDKYMQRDARLASDSEGGE